jgi:hypothetical protein
MKNILKYEIFEKLQYPLKDIKFVRYGGLSPVKQKHRKERLKDGITFHTPPRKKGLFAFPKGYEELFLIGSSMNPDHPSGKSAWLKDEKGNKIEWSEDIDIIYIKGKEVNIFPKWIDNLIKKKGLKNNQLNSAEKNGKWYITYLKKPRVFEYKGDLWCHFEEVARKEEIKEKFGEWIKVDYETYIKLFNRMFQKDLKSLKKDIDLDTNITNPYKGPWITLTKDHLEVFIEKLK